eukprot:gnl/TRDRNA2_/TRDRNA2_187859_c0_seq1.p1 gnl/TRDRNA2_/TRDRNA2_187859_c0~~gnl/TRDRNA2_/TRDRNA2_187859_c0_seq1.p1  ORF type:complete len:231 (+),score=40.39 gnl/TRDRNA2_/TRDRNA2_187859_c0_seq1:1-693(+)
MGDAKQSSTSSEGTSPGYGNGPGYWDARYQADPEPFEWLEGWTDLVGIFEELTDRNTAVQILHVGCGNSPMIEKMYDAGYRNIVNIDTSKVVIQQMADRNKGIRPDMAWQVMDATNMSFEDGSFDLVVDKSVMDTFACTDNATMTIARYMKEVTRVLRPGGSFVAVSYGAPETRRSFFQFEHLDLNMKEVKMPQKHETSNPHFAYVCRLGPDAATKLKEMWPDVASNLGR